MRIALAVCLVLSVLALCSPIQAVPSNVICVNGATGDDALYDGSDWNHPFMTIQAATDKANLDPSFTQIWVARGVYSALDGYHSLLVVPQPDTMGGGPPWIEMPSGVGLYGGFAGSEDTLDQRDWRQNQTVLDATDYGYPTVGCTGSLIDGFTIKGGTGIVSFGGDTISNNTFTQCDTGIFAASSGGQCEVTRSSFIGCATAGYQSNDTSGYIHDNLFVSNAIALECSDPVCDGTIVSNNTIVGNGTGIWGPEATIANNIVAFQTDVGIVGSDQEGYPILINNCVYDNGPGGQCNYSGADPDAPQNSGNISEEPGFADYANGHYDLAWGSPCIDAGIDAYVQTDDTDLAGNPRKLDIPGVNHEINDIVDIGAYELQFTCVDPTAPILTAPVGATNDLAPTVEWTATSDCDQYEVQILLVSDFSLVWDSGPISSAARSVQVQHLLDSGVDYCVTVGAGKQCGVSWQWAWTPLVQFTVNAAEPPLATDVPYCP